MVLLRAGPLPPPVSACKKLLLQQSLAEWLCLVAPGRAWWLPILRQPWGGEGLLGHLQVLLTGQNLHFCKQLLLSLDFKSLKLVFSAGVFDHGLHLGQ